MTLSEIQSAPRAELQKYLESWGFAVIDSEPLDLVREAAVENHRTEGDGWGPLEHGYPQR